MWFHWSTDVAVYSLLAAFAVYPAVLPLLKKIQGLRLPEVAGEAPERWRTDSVSSLISLQSDLESRKMQPAVKLCRELIWEILGGDAT